eukprot:UN13136
MFFLKVFTKFEYHDMTLPKL